MKFLHLSDLHIGRQLHRYSLQEEQTRMLDHLCRITASEKPDAVLIAGDVYDRSIPPVYATQLLDSFLARLADMAKVFIISGNHDSAERLSFLSGPLKESGLYISPAYRGELSPITLTDEQGPVDIWLLPFVKASTARPYFPEETIESTSDAVSCILRRMNPDPNRRNVLVAHQFVAGGQLSGSEESLSELSVGGTDMVDARLFSAFDYVALGHIHRAQNVGSSRIRYCGTPMAYDFSEAGMAKSVTLVELCGDRSLNIRCIPVPAPRALVEVRGLFEELTSSDAIRSADQDAYTHVTLTDNAPIPDVMNRLRQVYPRITHLDWDNARTRQTDDFSVVISEDKHTPSSLFADFFYRMGGTELSDDQRSYLDGLIHEIWEDNA